MFKYVFAVFLACLALVDFIFLPKQSRGAWMALTVGFVLAVIATFFTPPLERIAALIGIGRAVDVVIYLTCAILVRELFLTRGRAARQDAQLTALVRHLAIRDAEERA